MSRGRGHPCSFRPRRSSPMTGRFRSTRSRRTRKQLRSRECARSTRRGRSCRLSSSGRRRGEERNECGDMCKTVDICFGSANGLNCNPRSSLDWSAVNHRPRVASLKVAVDSRGADFRTAGYKASIQFPWLWSENKRAVNPETSRER